MRRRPRREGDAGTATSLDLFGDLPTFRWLPGETVYSIAARYGIATGIVTPSSTSKVLFGYHRGGFPHALPGGIDHFARVFKDALGSPREIISLHTIAPQLVASRSPTLREATYAAMEEGHAGTIKAKLGLLASGFGGALPLKACHVCLDEDELEKGFSYWRVSQQLPGVWLCTKHAAPLDISTAMQTGQARYAWILPNHDDLTMPCSSELSLGEAATHHLARLAGASNWLWAIGRRGGIDLARMAESLWDQLYAADLAYRHHRLRSNIASQSFNQFFDTMRVIPELERVAATPPIAYSQLLAVLNVSSNGLHPLRIASVIAWLFPTTTAFAQRYNSCHPESQSAIATPARKKYAAISAKRVKLLQLLASGSSISASARAVGVEIATGQAWAAAVGADVPRRASLVRGDRRDSLIETLRSGVDRTTAAAKFKISISSVSRILRTEARLHEAWNTARNEGRRVATRAAWTQALIGVGGRPKLARSMQPANYAWLYRNDYAWLKAANRSCDRRRSNNSAVNWGARDAQLSKEVLQTAEAIRAVGQTQVRLLDLLAKLPLLKRNLRNADHLPLTEHALAKVLKRQRRTIEPDLFS